MIYLYPANKMENLLVLLDKIQQVSPLPVFSQETIVVQNAGMQHWLNLSLAKQRGISMNVRYALPAQFLWKLLRGLSSDENIPEQSPYSREVLTWRIYSLLTSAIVCDDADFAPATSYWRGISDDTDSESLESDCESETLKCYQLAGQLADLYEQYLIFRPEWINNWHNGQTTIESVVQVANFQDDLAEQTELKQLALWQAKLWQLLIKDQPYNPASLLQKAITNIFNKKLLLPKRISFFGINAMPPMWLEFIHVLSEHIDIHFFHLNPCYAYWGDVTTEKQAAKAIKNWVDGTDQSLDQSTDTVGNPLLANLGQQGREFMALLQNYSSVNIDLFEHIEQESNEVTTTVLEHIQQDILSLTDRRTNVIDQQDDSITITSCHSALREVQGLHDWLLHQFNQDSALTPKDVLVMCPQIESYAPFINAVFTRGWQALDDEIPPLPCSIADRSAKDSEPIIAAFSDILNLPDSRFAVSQLVGLLRLPAMQLKFTITLDELAKITLWLEQAAIHWGLDKEHKAHILKSEQTTDCFTWQQGLSRLLRGFVFGDNFGQGNVIYQQQSLIPSIEGDDAILLGKLMLIIEQLQSSAQRLTQSRTAVDWQSYLLSTLDQLFDIDSEQSFSLIDHAIASLVEYCGHAHFEEEISLLIVREFLNNHFSQPDPGRQFMVGQVTFCSMLPMRSIPFKIIAVLGLNDGDFPRQRQPLGFDLMEYTPSQLGDRSRRGDDRYLFLEAIISARQSLYLSYQGRNIKNNKTKEASLVLKELMDYLTLGFSWEFNTANLTQNTDENHLRQLPMQAFSDKNYQGKYNCFDDKWLKLKSALGTHKQGIEQHNLLVELFIEQKPSDSLITELNVEQLIAFYQHPAKVFAQQQLNLYLDQKNSSLEDAEPFTINHLESYLLRQSLLKECLTKHSSEAQAKQQLNIVLENALLEGKFPDLPTTTKIFENWSNESIEFSQAIIEQNADNPEFIDVQVVIEITDLHKNIKAVQLSAKLPIKAQQLIFYRSSTAKAKDLFTLYVHQLIVQVYQDQNITNSNLSAIQANESIRQVTASHGFYFDTKSQKITEYLLEPIIDAKTQLTKLIAGYFLGQHQALMLNGDIADKAFKSHIGAKESLKTFEQSDFEKLWQDPNTMFALGNDSYMNYFWPECPDFSEHLPQLADIYLPMYQALEKVKTAKITKKVKGVS